MPRRLQSRGESGPRHYLAATGGDPAARIGISLVSRTKLQRAGPAPPGYATDGNGQPRWPRSRRAMARAIARLALGPAAITTIAAITEANVHRAPFSNHFTSVEEVAYAISIGFDEFQLTSQHSRASLPGNVAQRVRGYSHGAAPDLFPAPEALRRPSSLQEQR